REAGGGYPVLHLRDLGLQRRRGRVALAAVGVAGHLVLEDLHQVPRIGIAERHRHVHRLVDGIVLDWRLEGRVQNDGPGAGARTRPPRARLRAGPGPAILQAQKNPISLRGPGSRLALAVFVSRPQADPQIGAEGKLLSRDTSVKRPEITRRRSFAVRPSPAR